ncbi:unnamed protein product [Camellia sinensis]
MDVPSDHGRPFFLIINAWFAAFFGPASALIDTTSTKQGPHSIASLYHPKQLTRVNRELMGVIESLQHQNKKTEDNESSEETDCTCEKSDVVSGDAELCNVNSDILEEDEGKKGNQNSPSKSNHSKLTSERKLEVVIAYMKNPLRRLMQ